MRERFHISDPFPPSKNRKERQIESILSDILKEEEPQDLLPEKMEEYWRIAAGSQIAKHTSPEGIQNATLIVNVDHPGWLTEVRRLPLQPILKKINQVRSLPEIHNIRFKLDPSLQTKRYRRSQK